MALIWTTDKLLCTTWKFCSIRQQRNWFFVFCTRLWHWISACHCSHPSHTRTRIRNEFKWINGKKISVKYFGRHLKWIRMLHIPTIIFQFIPFINIISQRNHFYIIFIINMKGGKTAAKSHEEKEHVKRFGNCNPLTERVSIRTILPSKQFIKSPICK